MKQFGITFLPDVSGLLYGQPELADRSRQGVRHRRSGSADLRLRCRVVVRPRRGRILRQDEPRDHAPAADLPPVFADQGGRSVGLQPGGDQPSARPAVLEGHRRCSGRRSLSARRASGNDLAEVADRTRAAYQAGHGARPVWTVIQFFQVDLESAWPTEQQLHDMSWMAIVEGATGLFYWEYGVRGLVST